MSDELTQRLKASLADRFTIERELGGGGMSRVFVALEHALGRRVVIKTLPDGAEISGTAAERFRREILTAAQIEHANIVPVLAAGDAGGTPYFVMPWVDGESLRQRMQRGAIPLTESLSILRDVARALAAAHAHNVVHRDIKPENILCAGGAARVTDFGVAKALSAATHSDTTRAGMTGVGISIGTLGYMAPEQLAADPLLDHRADIYSWGVVAYEMLGGHYPFEGLTGASLMQAQLATVPTALALRAPALPSALSALVARTLAKSPDDRPQTAAQLVEALDAIPSTPSAAPATIAKSRFLKPGLIAAAVVVAGALVLWQSLSGGAITDERVIAVAPFRVSGASQSMQYLREGIADLMVPQLASIEGVKPTSSRQMFDSWRRTAGSMDVDLPDDRARHAAELVGAGQIILGSVVGREQGLMTIDAQLIRVGDGYPILRDTVVGVADSLFPMTARLTAKLLALRDGISRDRLRGILSAQPAAITSFLNGERLYRSGRYADAVKHFAESYRADTSFALAALRINICNGWIPDEAIPGNWLLRAFQHREHLTGNDSLLLAALTNPEYPKPLPQKVYYERLWTLASLASSAELWYVAADGLYHNGLASGIPDAMSRAIDGLKKAEAIDSSYAGALEHQSNIYAFMGDSARAREADRRQARIDSTGDFFVVAHAVTTFTIGSESERKATTLRMRSDVGAPAPWVAGIVSLGSLPAGTVPPDIRMAEALFESPALVRAQLRNPVAGDVLRDTYLNTGRPGEMAKVFPNDSSAAGRAADILRAMLWDGDTLQAQKAVIAIDRWRTTFRDTSGTATSNLPRLARALWAIEHNDTPTARRIREELKLYQPPPSSPWLGNTTYLYGKILEARLAVAGHASDAKSRLAELDSLLIDLPRIERRDARAVGNVLIAGMWEQVGEPKRAFQATQRRDMQWAMGAYGSTFLRLAARAAEAAGEREEAIRSLRAYVAMRAHAEPALKPDLESAKQRLARLESESRGK